MKQARVAVCVFFLLSTIGCGSRPVSNVPPGPVEIEHDGATVSIPASISFLGDEWEFIDFSSSAIHNTGTFCKYRSNTDRNKTLTLFLGNAWYDIAWSVRLHRVSDPGVGRRQAIEEWFRTKDRFAYYLEYADNTPNGFEKVFYANGQQKSIGHRDGTLKDGEYRAFRPDGSLWWTGEYKSDLFLLEKGTFYKEDGSVNEEIDTVDEVVQELDRWEHCQSNDSCDTIVEFLRKVDR